MAKTRRWLPIVLVLVAFALRLYRLDFQSLWHDEGVSWYVARSDLLHDPQVYLTNDPSNPPLYFLALGLWMGLAGATEFALRFFSLMPGLLLVALFHAVGRRIWGQAPALWTAGLVAVSPLYIYYSQETRMYSWAVLLSLASFAVFWNALRRGVWWRWVGWGLLTLLTFFLHYTGVFVALAQAVLLGLIQLGIIRGWVEPLPRRRLGAAVATLGVVSAAVVFWWGLVIPVSSVYGRAPLGGTSLAEMVRGIGVLFSLGPGMRTTTTVGPSPAEAAAIASLLAIPFWTVATAGLSPQRHRPLALALLATHLAIPVLAIWLISWGRRDFAPRYLMLLSPAYFLLLGVGLQSIWRRAWVGGGLTLLLIGATAYSLANLYFDPRYARDDYRGLVGYLKDRERGRDAIILNAGFVYPTIRYYIGDDIPLFPLPVPVTDTAVLGQHMESIAAGWERLWLVQWQDYYADPTGLARSWLETHAFRIDSQQFGELALYGYTRRPVVLTSLPPIEHPASLELEEGVRFLGYELDLGQLETKGKLRATLYWTSSGPTAEDLWAYVNLVDQNYRHWGGSDHRPAYDRLPTTTWKEGMIVVDEREIRVQGDLPPGVYRLAVGLYDPATGRTLRVSQTQQKQFYLGPFLWPPQATIPPAARAMGKTSGGLIDLTALDLGR